MAKWLKHSAQDPKVASSSPVQYKIIAESFRFVNSSSLNDKDKEEYTWMARLASKDISQLRAL